MCTIVARMASKESEQLTANARMLIPGPEYELIRQFVGTWKVQQRLWPAPNAEPMVLPPMVARRELIAETYLQEIMEPAPDSEQEPFTRIAYLYFNNVGRRYEYVSLDSRTPGLMYENSFDDHLEHSNTIALYLHSYTFPGWGNELTAQTIKQRRLLEVRDSRTIVCSQFWTLPAGEPFLAVEYVYTRADGA
jgi:hypothetical protein